MRIQVTSHRTVDYIVRLVLLGGAYYLAARLGLRYASIGASVSLIWPPTGIAFAALTLFGYRYWPGVALGAFLANAATPVPLVAAAGIAVGNTLESVVAAYLLRRSAGARPQLEDFRQVRTLVLVAAPVGALCGAAIGTLSLWLTEVLPSASLPAAAAVWWTGDVLGALVVAPVFFSWAVPAHRNTRRLVEVVVLCVGTAAVAELALGQLVNSSLVVDYQYLLFPFVIWAALRFGARGASLMGLAVAAVTIGHTVQGGGPFVSVTAMKTLIEVSSYLGVVAITGLVLTAAVQSERLQATTALAQSEERLRRALDAARMGTWFWSANDDRLTGDENLRDLYGLASGDQLSTHEELLQHVHPEDRESVREARRGALQQGKTLDHEFRVVLPHGLVRWLADQGEVHRDGQGYPTYVAGVSTDITDRRLAEERLRQAQRMESVGRLAGGVAHEANNQMSVVLAAADFILRRTDVPEAVRSDAEFIRKAAERTASVTAQLLAFSRRQILKPEVLNLNDLLTGWVTVLRRIGGEDCTVHLQLAPNLGRVRADPGQLEQVMLNLAINSRDAMPRGGNITVETYNAELAEGYAHSQPGTAVQPGHYVVLAVSDTGHGMDRKTMSHIFEPFFTTKGVGQGTGLGLSTVYGIVKQSDGYIWAYSEPGQGTTFKIYLPLLSESPTQPAIGAQPVQTGNEGTVLVVEDEASVRSVMLRALREAGFRVLEAESASEAVEMLSKHSREISLVLTDVVMPGSSGPELARHMHEKHPHTPVLFTSGYTDGEIARRGLLDPGAVFLQKPFTPAVLVHAVRERLVSPFRRHPPPDSGTDRPPMPA